MLLNCHPLGAFLRNLLWLHALGRFRSRCLNLRNAMSFDTGMAECPLTCNTKAAVGVSWGYRSENWCSLRWRNFAKSYDPLLIMGIEEEKHLPFDLLVEGPDSKGPSTDFCAVFSQEN